MHGTCASVGVDSWWEANTARGRTIPCRDVFKIHLPEWQARGIVHRVQDSPNVIGTQPARVLGPIDATCVVIGAIIGVGIFFTPSKVAGLVGSETLVLTAWGIGGIIALCGALAFAELGGFYHGSGAQYEIIRDSYGPMLGFLFVFCIATVIEPGSIGIMAVICAQNLLDAMGASKGTIDQWTTPLSLALILMLAGANILGARWGATIGNLSVLAKTLALLAVVGLAMYATAQGTHVPATTQPAIASGKSGIVAALLACMIPVLFSYGGWQQVLWVAGEVRNPRRNLPLSIVLGVTIVIAVYLLANWAYLRLLGVDGVAGSETLAADAVGAVLPNLGSRIVAGAVAVSAFGVLNVQFLTAPRLIYGLAADGRFFKPFARINPSFGTPIAAMMLLTVFAVVMLLGAGWIAVEGEDADDKLDQLLTAVVVVDGLFFVLTGIAVIVLRYKRANADRPFRVPGYPLVPILFALGELGLIVGSYVNAELRNPAIISAGWVIAGVVVYWVLFRTTAKRT